MLSKKKFVEYMTELKMCIDKHKQLTNAILELSDNGYCLALNIREENLIVKLLTELVHDKHELLIYYIYELDFGKNGKDVIYDEDTGKYTSLRTLEELYDYIVMSG